MSRNYTKLRTRGAATPQVHWQRGNHAKGLILSRCQFNNAAGSSKQHITMRQALDRLQVKYNGNLATQWQDVKCPVCHSDGAIVMLYGKHGDRGGFICNSCGTKGDGFKVFSASMGIPVWQVMSLWKQTA